MSKPRLSLLFAVPVLLLGMLDLAPTAASVLLEPIVGLKNVKPKASAWKSSNRNAPVVIKDWEAAAEHFDEEPLQALKGKVDLDQQVLLMFVWRGSGQDRLEFDVLESFPEQIVFTIKPGRTRDLRPHFHLFAVRSDVRWRMK